jgi:hypothetical protein
MSARTIRQFTPTVAAPASIRSLISCIEKPFIYHAWDNSHAALVPCIPTFSSLLFVAFILTTIAL